MERIKELLAKLAELDAEELEELHGLLDEEAARLADEDIAVTDEVIEEMKYVRDAIVAVKAEETARTEAEEERKRIADELRKEIAGTDPEDPDDDTADEDDATKGDEDEDAKAKVPVAAAATPPARPAPGAVRRRTTTPDEPPAAKLPALVASANLPNLNAGTDVSDPEKFADAFHGSYEQNIGYMGPRQKFPVVTARWSFPEDRILDDNAETNERKIQEFVRSYTAPTAITAAGGICAPAPIQYDLPTIGSTERPIRDALPNFGATRGAIRTIRPPTIDDVDSGGVTVWTAANDITPSSPTTKPCLTVTCGSDDTTSVDAIVECLRAGNFMDRYFRERIDAFQRLLMVWAARTAEQQLLAKIVAGSTAFTAGVAASGFGTTREVLAVLDRHIAAVRYYYRLGDNERFRLLAPRWLKDNMRTDLAREHPGSTAERLAMADAELERFLSVRGVNVSWIMEGESTQRWALPVAGHVVGWPSHVLMYLFPEGSWVFVNGGRLDLGQVRDSTLNGVNDFQMFAESFEQAHFHGTWSHKLDVDICPSGVTQLPLAINVCATGS